MFFSKASVMKVGVVTTEIWNFQRSSEIECYQKSYQNSSGLREKGLDEYLTDCAMKTFSDVESWHFEPDTTLCAEPNKKSVIFKSKSNIVKSVKSSKYHRFPAN